MPFQDSPNRFLPPTQPRWRPGGGRTLSRLPRSTLILGLPGATPIEGGLPLVVKGEFLGAIGVSGVTSEQDGEIAKMGAAVLG